jgi:hypothetical protein
MENTILSLTNLLSRDPLHHGTLPVNDGGGFELYNIPFYTFIYGDWRGGGGISHQNGTFVRTRNSSLLPIFDEHGEYCVQLGLIKTQADLSVQAPGVSVIPGRTYYIKARIKNGASDSNVDSFRAQFQNVTGISVSNPNGTATNLANVPVHIVGAPNSPWAYYDTYWVCPANISTLTLRVFFTTPANNGNNNKIFYLDNIMIIDMTQDLINASPSVPIPTLSRFRYSIRAAGGYWDGTLNPFELLDELSIELGNTLPDGKVGNSYSTNLVISGGLPFTGNRPPYNVVVTGLPSGLSYNATTGIISGIPTINGTFTVGVNVTDSLGYTEHFNLSLFIKNRDVITYINGELLQQVFIRGEEVNELFSNGEIIYRKGDNLLV